MTDLEEMASCPKCGYTEEDQRIHGDHYLCEAHDPENPLWTQCPRKTDRLEEMARECRCGIENQVGRYFQESRWAVDKRITALLRQVQRETRGATLEQAARFIETKRPSTGAIEAQAIRALSPEKSPKKPTVMDALIANVSRETSPEQEKS